MNWVSIAMKTPAITAQKPPITQVASGGVNPLKYRAMVDDISGWFTDHPLYDPQGQPILVPEWNFPGRGRVERQLNRAMAVLTRTEQVLTAIEAALFEAERELSQEDLWRNIRQTVPLSQTVSEQITGLRMLRYTAERDDAGAIKPYLDSESHSVKSEAVNALRVIVDPSQNPDLTPTVAFRVTELARGLAPNATQSPRAPP